LREAINAANANPGADIIRFDIPFVGVQTITPTSNLPTITEAVTIDGYTQPGASENTLSIGNNAVLLIELNGASAGLIPIGLNIAANNVVVRGLVINRFSTGININSDLNRVEGNFIGTGADGTTDLGNTFRGVSITVGDANLVEHNLISGNNGVGVVIFCCLDANNTIQSNYIGTNRNGTAALPNEEGVVISGSARVNVIKANVISGNNLNGIHVSDDGDHNFIAANFIGTDATGTVALPNGNNGILIDGQTGTIIGGTASGDRNVISGNLYHGISIISAGGANVVQGNYIGTDATGTVAVGNINAGVIIGYSPDNRVGGTIAGARNVLSGNATGVELQGAESAGTLIQGNYIGTDAAGLAPLGNSLRGVVLLTTTGATVGGIDGGNVIAFNTGAGVTVFGDSSGNSIFGNLIFANSLLGIDLLGGTENANGVTLNDFPDSDSGANNLQNYPTIDSITVSGFGGTKRTVDGELFSNPNTDYVLHFYSNNEVDPSGFGEGKFYLGALNKHSDAQGHLNFSFSLNAATGGKFITATATDPNGNTSEFSRASVAVPETSTFSNISTRAAVQTGNNVVIAGFIITGSGNKLVLLRALGPTLGRPPFNVAGALANPAIQLYSQSSLIASNDNWGSAANAGSIPQNLRPPDSLESAILISLAPGSYTAIVRGAGNTTGVGLAEVYDLDSAAGSYLSNISTRSFVQTGDKVTIAGLIVEGGSFGEQVLIRALGPTLAAFNVPNVLANPTLELRNANGTLLQANDNWKDTQQSEIAATQKAPQNDAESAILRTLTPGTYTAIVRGKNNSVGNALVEVYEIP
jgi:hypothetical protein